MDIKPVRNERDYRAALADIDALMDVDDDTPEADRLEVLATLVEAYEDEHWPIDPPDPSRPSNIRSNCAVCRGAISCRFLARGRAYRRY